MKITAKQIREAKALLTEQELTTIKRAMHSTWATVADDCGPEGTIKRWDAIEITLDANYLESYGGNGSAEVIKKFRALTYDQQNAIAADTFQSSRY